MTRCLNCNCEFDHKFCPECGQKAATTRLSWHSITHDLQHVLLHLDKGVLKNIRSVWQPQLIRDYIAGKRVGYFNPIVLLLFVCGIVAWVEHYFKTPIMSNETITDDDRLSIGYKIGHTAAAIFHDWSKYVEALLVLPLGYFSWLFMRSRTKYNLIENIYVQAFIVCNLNLIGLIFFPVLRQFSPVLTFNLFTAAILLCLMFLVFNQIKSPITRLLQVTGAILLSYATYVAMFFLVAYIMVKIKGI